MTESQNAEQPEQPEQIWYHGTKAGFGRGGVLLPKSVTGRAGTSAPVNPGFTSPPEAAENVFVTRDIGVAWVYAVHATGRGRPKVLVVEPRGPVERDPEHSYRTDAWRCSWAQVLKVLNREAVAAMGVDVEEWAAG